jgi:GntR family transcriptional regulator
MVAASVALKIDKRIPIPAYYQLREILRKRIENKEWRPGDRLPSEIELSRVYRINRMTVRQAVLELCREGFLYREQGRGTFLARQRIERTLSDLDSQISYLRSRGEQVTTKVLTLRTIPASPEIQKKLRLTPGEQLIELVRLRVLNGTPFFLETSLLPFSLCKPLMKEDFTQRSLYDLLEIRCGFNLDWADVLIEAIPADPVHCAQLKVKKGTPLLRLEQVTYLENEQPVQFLEGICRSDQYKYRLIRRRRKQFHL